MAVAIDDREARLAAANRRTQELLDHMRQAIVVFGAGGVVEGAGSRQAADVFGLTELGGRKVQDLLFPEARASNVEARAFVEWLALAFDADGAVVPARGLRYRIARPRTYAAGSWGPPASSAMVARDGCAWDEEQ